MLCYVILAAVTLNFVQCSGSEDVPKETGNERQERLLFYDEEGNLVKTYTNPFLRQHALSQEKLPAVGYFSPFFNFFKPPATTGLAKPYMIPVTESLQPVPSDPLYQNKVFFLPAQDQSIELNPMCAGKRAQIPSPTSCNMFLNCWDGWSYEQTCPPGLMFSNEGFCDFAHNVNCYDRKDNSDAEEARCEKDFEAFRSELSCREFYVCVGKVPVHFRCPADLLYNQELGICDYSTRVNCNASYEATPPSSGEVQKLNKIDPPSLPTPAQGNMKFSMTQNSFSNTQSFTSTHMAMSRQDAIRQLELRRLAKVQAGF